MTRELLTLRELLQGTMQTLRDLSNLILDADLGAVFEFIGLIVFLALAFMAIALAFRAAYEFGCGFLGIDPKRSESLFSNESGRVFGNTLVGAGRRLRRLISQRG